MIKDFMTAYWGYLPTTSKPYPVHQQINAFVGRKGHGKTTAWDALRLALGDASFENKRNDTYYIHPDSNWAVVRLGVDNTPDAEGNRPFAQRKYFSDTVVLCCRIARNGEDRQKEYYIFDHEFTDIIDLGQNPRAYRNCQVKSIREYNQILYECMGISDQFRRLMAMNPDRVRELITLSPNELFRRVFDLTGNKKYKDNYENAKVKLNELAIEIERTKQDLAEAAQNFEEAKKTAEAYDRFIEDRTKLVLFERRLKVIQYVEAHQEIDKTSKSINLTSEEIRRLATETNRLEAMRQVLLAEVEDIERNIQAQSDLAKDYREQALQKANAVGKKETIIADLQTKIDNAQNIERIDIDILEKKADDNFQKYSENSALKARYEAELKRLEKRLAELNRNYNAKPHWVESFTNTLTENHVRFTVLSNTISVKKGFEKWQRAIEAYLGNNRYRIIVPPDQYVNAKKLQERSKYTARVSVPRPAGVNPGDPSLPYPTIWSVLDIHKQEEVGYYIRNLQRVYLVETVEEGHKLQQKGIESITLQGLQQDADGAIFREAFQLCCGQYAIELEKIETERSWGLVSQALSELRPVLADLKKHQEMLEQTLRDQQELGKLPEYEKRLSQLSNEAQGLKNEIADITEKQFQAEQEKDRLQEEKLDRSSKMATGKQKMEINGEEIKRLNKSLQEFRIRLDALQKAVEDKIKELRKMGFSGDDIEGGFLESDVQNSPDYRNEGGQIYASEEIQNHCRKLENAVADFHRTYPDVNEGYSTVVRSQADVLASLETTLRNLDTQRIEWEASCNNDLVAFKNHLREMVNDYIEEFKHLAELMNARGGGSLEQVGDANPEAWQLHMSIGFDGKNPTPIDGPDLSSGQRACTSLMLLLSAINNRKRGEIVPVMFLDEPNSRVDDDTGNEIGHLLQATKLQYFITHQMGEAIKNITWFNHSFVVSIKDPQAKFAQPMILQIAREGY